MNSLAAVGSWIVDRVLNPSDWLPMGLSIIATGISILAYRRGSPPVEPKAWTSFEGRGSAGFTVALHVNNHTDATVHLNDASARGYKLGINRREVRDDRPEWEPPVRYDYDWVASMPIGTELAPGSTFTTNVVFSNVDTRESIKASLVLSISTTRRTIKNRAIVVPIIIPAAT